MRCLVFLSVCLVLGCQKGPVATQNGHGNDGSPDTTELAQALGARWWSVQLPKGSQGQFLKVTFLDENGPIASSGGGKGWNPDGETVRFFLFDTSKETIRYAVVGDSMWMRGEMKNELQSVARPDVPISTVTPPVRNPAKPGDIFIKSGAPGASIVPSDVQKGEIGITLTLTDVERTVETDSAARVDVQRY